MISRVCGDCGADTPIEGLAKASGCKHGVRRLCKKCSVLRSQKAYNPVKKAEYDKERRKRKGDELREYDRERSQLPHRKAAKNESTRRRRAALRDAIPDDYDRDGVLSMYRLAQKLTKLTGVQMHVDHVIPLAAGGEHNVYNLQLLEATLNVAKGSNPHYQLPWRDYDADE